MTAKIPVSVFLVTLNEGNYLDETLAALKDFDEIILVDSGSTDQTLEIAARHQVTVVHQDWLGFARQKNYAMSLCKHDWVMNIDGDETLAADMPAAIAQLIKNPEFNGYRLFFDDLFWGQSMSRYSAKRSIIRLFRKDCASYPLNRKVHENLVMAKDSKVGRVPGLVRHYGYNTTEGLMSKQNKYSSLKAEEKFLAGKKASLLKLSVIFPLTFIKSYLLKKMFLSGKRGLTYAYIEALYAFMKEAKLFEYDANKKAGL